MFMLFFIAMDLHATTRTVSNGNDAGPGSLREVLNTSSNGDEIIFDPSVTIVTLTSGQITITADVIISGVNVTITSNYESRILEIQAGAKVTLDGLTLEKGISPNGSAILNNGHLIVKGCTIQSSGVPQFSSGEGAGIYNSGSLEVYRSIFKRNFAAFGGALYTSGNTFIVNCTFDDNDANQAGRSGLGAAIYAVGAADVDYEIIIKDTDFIKNFAGEGDGGAIYSTFEKRIELINCLFENNSVFGGSAGKGGAVFGKVRASNCVFNKNNAGISSAKGGAFYGSDSEFINCTFTENSVTGLGSSGGAVYGFDVTLTNCTIINNDSEDEGGGGLYGIGNGIEINNTIISGNRLNNEFIDSGNDLGGTITSSLGHNIIGDTTGYTMTGVMTDNITPGVNPLVTDPANFMETSLRDNGGRLYTLALTNGSLAIDAGTTGDGVPSDDQRGLIRDATPDIGAYEAGAGTGAGSPFITTWKTDNSGTSGDTQITIPTTGSDYNYMVTWEEVGNSSNNGTFGPFTGNATIDFPTAGTYQVSISGDFPRIYFNNEGDKAKIQSINQWGDQVWISMSRAFFGCNNLISDASDSPDLTQVTSMSYMFFGATSFNSDISGWDVSNVTNMFRMFRLATSFNSDISGWDVSKVTSMYDMFYRATSFDQDLSNWDVSNVTNMSSMFDGATSFDSDISGWDVSNVTNMRSMFDGATSFNSDISGWDVSKVTNMSSVFDGATSFNSDISGWDVSNATNMSYMFFRATSFNSDISKWDVSNVTNMFRMFRLATSFNSDISGWNVSHVTNMYDMFNRATSFDQDLSNWDVSNVMNMRDMLSNSGLSSYHYNELLKGWRELPSLQSDVELGASGLSYCDQDARDILTSAPNNWKITGDTRSTDCGGFLTSRQVDFDGTEEQYEAITAENNIHNVSFEVVIYPNPGSAKSLRVSLASDDAHTAIDISIIGLGGKRYFRKQFDGGLKIDESLDFVDDLTPGLYFIEVRQGASLKREKLIVK